MTRRDFSPPEREPDLLLHVLARELESAQRAAERADAVVGEILDHLLPDREVGAQDVEGLLREVAEAKAGAEPHLPESGSMAPAIILSSVDFPAPFLPITQ